MSELWKVEAAVVTFLSLEGVRVQSGVLQIQTGCGSQGCQALDDAAPTCAKVDSRKGCLVILQAANTYMHLQLLGHSDSPRGTYCADLDALEI